MIMNEATREERRKRLALERKNNFIRSAKNNYVLNFIDTLDELQRYDHLKMYFHTEKQIQPASHTYSYLQLKKSYTEMEELKIGQLEFKLTSE